MDKEWFSIGFDPRMLTDADDPVSIDPLVLRWPKSFDHSAAAAKGKLNSLNLFSSEKNILSPDICKEPFQLACATVTPSLLNAISVRYGEEFSTEKFSTRQLISNGWSFRGYDVCDLRGLISGILGCGDISSYQKYVERLNSSSLFDDIYLAREFAEWRSVEIPSHAPFITIGIYLRRSI